MNICTVCPGIFLSRVLFSVFHREVCFVDDYVSRLRVFLSPEYVDSHYCSRMLKWSSGGSLFLWRHVFACLYRDCRQSG
jgi:hypothetical protein